MSLVARELAIGHLGIPTPAPDSEADRDLEQKRLAAEAIVLAQINASLYWRTVTPLWDDLTVPREVQAAILLELGDLWVTRGDGNDPKDDRPRDPAYGLLVPVVALLKFYLDPAV